MDRIAVTRPFIWFAVVLAATVIVWLPASTARACHVTDPSCVTGTAGSPEAPANEAKPDDVAGTVGGIVEQMDDAADPVEDVVDSVEETARNAADDVPGDTLPDLLDPDPNVEPPPPDPDGVGDRPSGDDTRGGRNDRRDATGRRVAAIFRIPAGRDALAPGTMDASFARTDERPTPSAGIGRVIEQAARVAFPLLLTLLLAVFVLAQHRIDSRDPRLALSPMGPDDLGFA
jgi:hypothetical protein